METCLYVDNMFIVESNIAVPMQPLLSLFTSKYAYDTKEYWGMTLS